MIITIDGISCQGKSYIGKRLAKELGMEFLSTGKLVRYVSYIYSTFQDMDKESSFLFENAVEIMKRTEMSTIINCPFLNSEKTEMAMEKAAEYPYVFDEVSKVIISYAINRDIVLDGRFTYLLFPKAHRSYYFISSLERRIALISDAKKMSHDEAVKYISFRDSFEKTYNIPAGIKKIQLDDIVSSDDFIRFLKDDVRGDG